MKTELRPQKSFVNLNMKNSSKQQPNIVNLDSLTGMGLTGRAITNHPAAAPIKPPHAMPPNTRPISNQSHLNQTNRTQPQAPPSHQTRVNNSQNRRGESQYQYQQTKNTNSVNSGGSGLMLTGVSKGQKSTHQNPGSQILHSNQSGDTQNTSSLTLGIVGNSKMHAQIPKLNQRKIVGDIFSNGNRPLLYDPDLVSADANAIQQKNLGSLQSYPLSAKRRQIEAAQLGQHKMTKQGSQHYLKSTAMPSFENDSQISRQAIIGARQGGAPGVSNSEQSNQQRTYQPHEQMKLARGPNPYGSTGLQEGRTQPGKPNSISANSASQQIEQQQHPLDPQLVKPPVYPQQPGRSHFDLQNNELQRYHLQTGGFTQSSGNPRKASFGAGSQSDIRYETDNYANGILRSTDNGGIDSDEESIHQALEFAEDPIEKLNRWKARKNITSMGQGAGKARERMLPDRDSPKSTMANFSPWTEAQVRFTELDYHQKFDENQFDEEDAEEDLELLAERNYECLLDYDDQKAPDAGVNSGVASGTNQAKLTYWQIARIKEEEEIKKINFENFMLRQMELADIDRGQQDDDSQRSTSNLPTANSAMQPASHPNRNDATRSSRHALQVNTSYCRTELETVQYVCERMAMQDVQVGGHLYWFGLALSDKDVKIMSRKKCFFNRYPGTEYLARKKVFCSINNRMRRTFPKIFNFSPISFLVPEETTALENYMEQHPRFFFIGKPSCGRGGEGIILLQKMKDIPNSLSTGEKKDMLVQRYIKTPLLIDNKKFDLRLYVVIVGLDPIHAYLADEGLARLCAENYRQPNAQNMKNMFTHLTNFSLNKESKDYKPPTEDFLTGDDSGSKRLLTNTWKVLEAEGCDVEAIKEKIRDTLRKSIISLEPYLLQMYHSRVGKDHRKSKCFQILGMDVLIDRKYNAWLMEINSNPSLNMFLEKESGLSEGETPERILQELDKFVKSRVIGDAIRIVTGQKQGGCAEFDGTFEQILPHEELGYYYIWNRAQQLFELMSGAGKEPERVTGYQFNRLARVPAFAKANQYFKADLEIIFKNISRKYECTSLDIYAFFEAIEALCVKIYKPNQVAQMHAQQQQQAQDAKETGDGSTTDAAANEESNAAPAELGLDYYLEMFLQEALPFFGAE